MKRTYHTFYTVAILVLALLIPDRVVSQVSGIQDAQPKHQSKIRFNNKKLMKLQYPGMEVSDKVDNPYLRADYERARLIDPATGSLPTNIRQKELDFAKSKLTVRRPKGANSLKAAGDQTSPWINRGPFNIGGRTRAIAIDRTDENILYAGGVSGGLWRSTDQGSSWTKLTPGQEHPSVTDLMQDPRDGFENVWYYSTGERLGNSASDGGAFFAGNGIYKSTDGGLTFEVLPATVNLTPESFSSDDPFDLIFGIDINPLNGDLYVATYVGVHRSTDGGATFEEVLTAPFDNESDIHITASGVLYATVASDAVDAGVFRSTDGAPGTWTNITPSGFPSSFSRTVIHTAPSNEDVLYLLSVTGSGTTGMDFWKYTYLSGDGSGAGGTWEDRSANVPALGGFVGNFNPQGGYNLLVRVHPQDEDLVFIGGTNLYRSFDGFATAINDDNWIGGYAVTNDVSLYTNHHPDQHGMEFFASNPDKVFSSHDGGITITDDIQAFDAGGPLGNESVTWTDLNNGYLTTQTYALSIGPGDQLQAGFQDQSTWFTNNTGSTNPWTVVAGADGSYNAFNDDGTFRYVSYQNGTTFRQAYTDADSDTPLNQIFITPSSASGFLFVNPYELDPNNDEIMYMAGGSTLWRNDNLPNATTTVGWTGLTNATISGSISAIGISTNPANVVYIGSSLGSIIRIDDANVGSPTGVDVSGVDFPSGTVSSIDVNPNNADDVIAAFSNYSVISIWRSIDGGASWENIGGNLEENADGSGSGPSVRWVTRVGSNDRFFAATSVGLYSTTELNGAATVWEQEDPDGIGNVVIEQIRKRDEDGLVVLGTHGNGLYSANFEVTEPPISVVEPLANFEVELNSLDTIIDVSGVFVSNATPPLALTLSVDNSNTDLLSATLTGTDLTISFTADVFGDATVTLSAADTEGNEVSDAFSVTVNAPPVIISEFPYLETFEEGANGPGSLPSDWELVAVPPYQWTVISGPTPTGGFNGATGPLVDHTLGDDTGFYVYTEASGGAVGDTTELITPPVVISSLENPSFEFYYHLFGDDIVSFEVEVISEVSGVATNVFTRTGPVQTAQTDPYELQIVPLSAIDSDTVRILFRGIRGAVVTDGFLGDIAIDDVRFFDGPDVLVVASPSTLSESLEQGDTSTQSLTLTNAGSEDITFSLEVEDTTEGVAVTFDGLAAVGHNAVLKRTDMYTGEDLSRSILAKKPGVANFAGTSQYATGFEDFLTGDISNQEDWVGQFGNWTIEANNPSDGLLHFSGLADGFGQSLAFSPQVEIGVEPLSSIVMDLSVDNTNVTWQIIPQSTTAGFVNTILEFSPDGTVSALISDGAGGSIFTPVADEAPTGYFNLRIEVVRATNDFSVYFDEVLVFEGEGFAGDIEQLVVLSLMEEAGPVLDMDNIAIVDGSAEGGVTFAVPSVREGLIPAGSTFDIEVTFNADIDFGTYGADFIFSFNEDPTIAELVVPVELAVTGPALIDVDPTVIVTEVEYGGVTTSDLTLDNIGGEALTYELSIIGGTVSAFKDGSLFERTAEKKPMSVEQLAKKASDDSKATGTKSTDAPALYAVIGEVVLEESFEGTFPPMGWETIDNEGNGLFWGLAADFGDGNYVSSGEAATANSDEFGVAEYDTELRTPSIDISGKSDLYIQYSANYQNLNNLDFLDLDVSTDGGSTWTTMLSWNEDHGGFFSTPGELVTVSMDEFVQGASSMIVRWRYYNPNEGDWDWYAQIDDVVLFEEADMWLSLEQTAGEIPVGSTLDVPVIFDASLLDGGDFRVAGIVVTSNATNEPEVGVVAALDVMQPAEAIVSVTELSETLLEKETSVQSFTIANEGESTLTYNFEDIFFVADPVTFTGAPAIFEARTVPVPVSEAARMPDARAIAVEDFVSRYESMSSNQYATDFEGFTLGDILGQSQWFGQYGNWVIDNANPFGREQHLRSLSDGLGSTLAFSPQVAVGSEEMSSTVMKLNLAGSGVTWDIIPQSNTAGFVNTIVRFNLDGSISILNEDGGATVLTTIPEVTPEGYFDLGIEVDRTTAEFVVTLSGVTVFEGQGFAGDIEQVVLRSFMEVAGPTLDLDNLQIIDGEIFDPFVSVSPVSGTLATGEQVEIEVLFDAENLMPGSYSEDLIIYTNDPVNEEVVIPTTLDVLQEPTMVVGQESLSMITAIGAPSTATFDVTNEGDLDLYFSASSSATGLTFASGTQVVADTLEAGAMVTFELTADYDSAGVFVDTVTMVSNDPDLPEYVMTVEVTVYPAAGGITGFSLVDPTTDEVLDPVENGDMIDVNTLFSSFSIMASTYPAEVGSVVFKLDGQRLRTENVAPYASGGDKNGDFFSLNLDAGTYTMTAIPYSEQRGGGDAGQELSVTFEVFNSDSIAYFMLVNSETDEELESIADGDVIELIDDELEEFTIAAVAAPEMVGSVEFMLDGKLIQVESAMPYSASGDRDGNYRKLRISEGEHTLTATPYNASRAKGIAGVPLSITFTVVEGEGDDSMRAYPNPIEGNGLTITLAEETDEEVTVEIVDLRGIVRFSTVDRSSVQRGYIQLDDVSASAFKSGVYLIKVSVGGETKNIRLLRK